MRDVSICESDYHLRNTQISLLRFKKKFMYAQKQRRTVVLATGNKNPQFGIYKTVWCGYEIVVTEGARFPDCHEHKRPGGWALVVAIDRTRAKKRSDYVVDESRWSGLHTRCSPW